MRLRWFRPPVARHTHELSPDFDPPLASLAPRRRPPAGGAGEGDAWRVSRQSPRIVPTELVSALRLVAECADHSVDDYHLRAIVRTWCTDRANELEARPAL